MRCQRYTRDDQQMARARSIRNEQLFELQFHGFQSLDVLVPIGVAENGEDLVLIGQLVIGQRQQGLVQFRGGDFAYSRESAHE